MTVDSAETTLTQAPVQGLDNAHMPAQGLQSSSSMQRLEQIAELRARGIGNHIPLPQLVVCGDQSAGKSSVLEGLTGIPFPRQDGLCTTFATEIILQHSPDALRVTASLIAGPSRTLEEKKRIEGYHAEFQDFTELPRVIRKVAELTGVRQPGSQSLGPAFVEDVLRIVVHGPLGLHLSVVDLPGLITVPNEEQSDEDVDIVHRLVDSYVKDPRTIILAVVQAGNDIANQPIIQKARKFDQAGERTVGIITKPDLINETSEKRIALLASNKDTTKLKLGFFLVKNPNPSELSRGISPEERHKNEIRYFQSPPWKEQALDPRRTGILALRLFLQNLLDRHIEKELPKVRSDIQALLRQTEADLAVLGEERSDAGRMRTYLTRLAMYFHQLTTSALNGTYEDITGSFFDSGQNFCRRLRAQVQQLNIGFADTMRARGAKRQLGSPSDGLSSDSDEEDLDETIIVSEAEMKAWIKKVYQHNRGIELPGTYNHVLLGELFREQASRWKSIAVDHVSDVADSIKQFVDIALKHVVLDDYVLTELNEFVGTSLSAGLKAARDELSRLWEDEKHQPLTYNHYFTDNIQKARQQGDKSLLKKAMTETREQDWHGKMHISNTPVDLERLLNGLQQRIIVNMDEQACSEALSALNAYYKVALKTFVDNVCRQVVERHLMRRLPAVFSPTAVAAMEVEDLGRIASETSELSSKRKELQGLQQNLSSGLEKLRKGKRRVFEA